MESPARKGSLPITLGRTLRVWLEGWAARWTEGKRKTKPRLSLVERVSLAPRQSLALVEAEGRKFLVATSQESGTTFYALGASPRNLGARPSRVSW